MTKQIITTNQCSIFNTNSVIVIVIVLVTITKFNNIYNNIINFKLKGSSSNKFGIDTFT